MPTCADPDVWIRDAGDCYECVVVHVDDTFTALKDPDPFCAALTSAPWNCKLKNVEEPNYHLGGDFSRDADGAFCCGASTCVNRIVENFKNVFGEAPTECVAPLDKNC